MARYALIVDDSKTIREIVIFALKNAEFEVLEAENGQHAIEVLGDKKVDIILTDLNMPKMNGIDFIKYIRSSEHHKSTPVLMLTTESDGNSKLEGKEAGATGWIIKPFNPDKLISVINKVCVAN